MEKSQRNYLIFYVVAVVVGSVLSLIATSYVEKKLNKSDQNA